jgi:hypothetical protein
MNVEAVVERPPLVLLVDPIVASRHWMWRTLSGGFGVLEAGTAGAAREWLERRPEIDALVVRDELPDGRGGDLVSALAVEKHPVASRSIVLSGPGDVRGVLSQLAQWFLARNPRLARALVREADRSTA